MMERVGLGSYIFAAGKPLSGISLSQGEVIKAEVFNITSPGNAVIRIKGNLIPVESKLPFEVGQILNLRVGEFREGRLSLEFIGYESKADGSIPSENRIQGLIQDLERLLSEDMFNVRTSDIYNLLSRILKALPSGVSLPIEMRIRVEMLLLAVLKTRGEGIHKRLDTLINQVPDTMKNILTENLRTLRITIDSLEDYNLRAAVENTGVLLETKLRHSAEGIPEEKGILTDLKTNLMRLAEEGTIKKTVETILRDIETFQTLSKVTDSFYTFLPLIWKELRDGNISFKRGDNKGKEASFSCRIKLEFERLGGLVTMVTFYNKGFFITFVVEDQGFRRVIEDNKEYLKRLFSERGLDLKAVNVMAGESGASWLDRGIDIRT